MASKLKSADIVIVGLGWTGGILAKELAETGLSVVVLERGGHATLIRISCTRSFTTSCDTPSVMN
jgi:choline dehydrogenase-like flavoprotein